MSITRKGFYGFSPWSTDINPSKYVLILKLVFPEIGRKCNVQCT